MKALQLIKQAVNLYENRHQYEFPKASDLLFFWKLDTYLQRFKFWRIVTRAMIAGKILGLVVGVGVGVAFNSFSAERGSGRDQLLRLLDGAIAGTLLGASLGAVAGVGFYGRVLSSEFSTPKKLRGFDRGTSESLNAVVHYRYRDASLKVGEVILPGSNNTLVVGTTRMGKTQSIHALLHQFRDRDDVRFLILDSEAESLQRFYSPKHDKIFNPLDARSLGWSHYNEISVGVSADAIASSLIPIEEKDRFWSDAARALFAVILRNTQTNAEVNYCLSRISDSALRAIASSSPAERIISSESEMTASIRATISSRTAFYGSLPDLEDDEPFSFYQWGVSNDPRSIFIPILKGSQDAYTNLYALCTDLAIKGLLSRNQNKGIKTYIICDELPALGKIPSLGYILSEGSKHNAFAILGFQLLEQVKAIYGDYGLSTMLQNCNNKLIFRCPDPKTADAIAQLLGKGQYSRRNKQWNAKGEVTGFSEYHATEDTFSPDEIKGLQRLTAIARVDNIEPCLLSIQPREYAVRHDKFCPLT